MYHSLFLHSPTEGHLGCFLVLAVLNKAAINIRCKFLCGYNFQLLWVNTEERDCWIVWREYVWFRKKPAHCLPKCSSRFAFPPAVNERSCCSTSSSAFGAVSVLDFGRSHKCVVVSHSF